MVGDMLVGCGRVLGGKEGEDEPLPHSATSLRTLLTVSSRVIRQTRRVRSGIPDL